MGGGGITEIGALPKDWDMVNLSQVFKLASGTSRPKDISETRSEKMPYPIYGGNGILGYTDQFVIDKEAIVIGRVGEYCGSIHRAPRFSWISDNALYASEILIDNINLDFLIYELTFINLNQFKKISGQPLMTQTIINSIKIPLPPLPEQRCIAEVLGTVDNAIQKVGGAIESTERLTKGLMQRLLTKGIGHERFKESELGRVPEEWEVVRLGDVCNQKSEITMPSGKGENKFVGLEHINPGEIKIHTYQLDTDVKSSKFRFRRGEILYGKLRPYLDKAVIADFEGICSTDLLVLTNIDNKALAEFLIYLIHSNKFIQNSNSATSGTNHPRTSWKEISKFKFGLPPLPEQRRIAKILSAVDRKLELERRRKEKLERVKKGLMNELLTGRKRVKVETDGNIYK